MHSRSLRGAANTPTRRKCNRAELSAGESMAHGVPRKVRSWPPKAVEAGGMSVTWRRDDEYFVHVAASRNFISARNTAPEPPLSFILSPPQSRSNSILYPPRRFSDSPISFIRAALARGEGGRQKWETARSEGYISTHVGAAILYSTEISRILVAREIVKYTRGNCATRRL